MFDAGKGNEFLGIGSDSQTKSRYEYTENAGNYQENSQIISHSGLCCHRIQTHYTVDADIQKNAG